MNETEAETPVTCTGIAEHGHIERYVAGTLATADAEALEAHLLNCPRCQTELRLAVAIRSALREPAAVANRRRFFWVALLAAAAAAIVLFVAWPRTIEGPS